MQKRKAGEISRTCLAEFTGFSTSRFVTATYHFNAIAITVCGGMVTVVE